MSKQRMSKADAIDTISAVVIWATALYFTTHILLWLLT